MGEAPNIYPNLNDQTQLRLKKTNEIKNYLIIELFYLQQVVEYLLLLSLLLLVHLQG